jgi:hypothetical protein
MATPKTTPSVPTGLAFEITDLMLLQGWAEFHGVQMVVELDHCVEGEEYEEVVAFYAKDNAMRRWILWRAGPNEIVVQPLIGRGCRYDTVAEALESLVLARQG